MTDKKEKVQKPVSLVESGLSSSIFPPDLIELYGLDHGLKNLSALPSSPIAVPGKQLDAGLVGFRRWQRGQTLALVCGVEPVQYLSLSKFVALIDRADNKHRPNVVLQNFAGGGDDQDVRGQILARLSLKHSAIIVCHGAGGKSIKCPKDILWTYVYSIERFDLATYYMAAKRQVANSGLLEELIEANDGQCVFDVPLDHVNPRN